MNASGLYETINHTVFEGENSDLLCKCDIPDYYESQVIKIEPFSVHGTRMQKPHSCKDINQFPIPIISVKSIYTI